MNRRDFLRAMGLAGAAAVIDISGVGSAVAQTASRAKTGADLVAVMGGEPDKMLIRMLAEYGGIEKFVKKGMKVVLKPNIGWDRTPELAGNTNPVLVGEMVRQCLKAGASQVVVFDHTCHNWIKCYENSGIQKAVVDAGGKMVPAHDQTYYVDVDLPRGKKLKKAQIHKELVDCDVWFNMPILKHHGGAKLTISMKNYMGIVWDRQVFHKEDLQQCIADIVTFNKKPALHIVDAYRSLVQNGPQGKSADDVVMLRSLLASADPVAVDTASLKLFAQAKPVTMEAVSHIGNAERLMLGTTNLNKLNVKRIKM